MEKIYNLFQFECGDNTFIDFVVAIVIVIACIVIEIIKRKKGGSWLF